MLKRAVLRPQFHPHYFFEAILHWRHSAAQALCFVIKLCSRQFCLRHRTVFVCTIFLRMNMISETAVSVGKSPTVSNAFSCTSFSPTPSNHGAERRRRTLQSRRTGFFCDQLGGANILTFKRATAFCMGHRFSKHKTTRYARNLGVHGPLAPGYTCLGLRWRSTWTLWKTLL